MTVAVLALIVFVLGVALMWSSIINRQIEAALNKTKDLLLSMTTGRKMIVPRYYMRTEEQEYLKKLEDMFKGKYFIEPQVHLSDIADVKYGYYDHDNLFYELKRIILDYVIFDMNYKPLVGIELNGKSHLFKSRKSRDKFTQNLLANIGVEYLEICLDDVPNRRSILEKLETKIALAKTGQVFPRAYHSPTNP